jgi:hypothetical protein
MLKYAPCCLPFTPFAPLEWCLPPLHLCSGAYPCAALWLHSHQRQGTQQVLVGTFWITPSSPIELNEIAGHIKDRGLLC